MTTQTRPETASPNSIPSQPQIFQVLPDASTNAPASKICIPLRVEVPYHSSPFRLSTSHAQEDGRYPDDRIVQFLRDEIKGKLRRKYPIIEFVEHVWKSKVADLPAVQEMRIPAKYVIHYLGSKYITNRGAVNTGERGCSDPLRPSGMKCCDNLGSKIEGNFTELGPDFLISLLFRIQDHDWNAAGGVGEIKELPSKHATTKVPLNAPPPSNNPATPTSRPVAAVKQTGTKRKLDETGVQSFAKRQKSGTTASQSRLDLTDKELQTAKYLNELLSHHVRSYGTGFLLDQTKMTLWYCDRMGLVQSESFDIFEAPEYVALVLVALANAGPDAMGIYPFLNFPSSEYFFEGASLTLSDAVGAEDESLGDVTFDLDISDSRKLIKAPGCVGRGTVVIPIKTKSRISEARFIKIKHDVARQYLKHIVEVKYSPAKPMKDMKLPRTFMSGVRGRRARNFMFYRAAEHNRAIGVLRDWDPSCKPLIEEWVEDLHLLFMEHFSTTQTVVNLQLSKLAEEIENWWKNTVYDSERSLGRGDILSLSIDSWHVSAQRN
ncbi:hypothetical protein OBBRIDRAFT_805483 [Obba rivulosa]|uniref:Fungal-type protein kinase domain-containing protein n=1 Tax=Obba rivulosa TaxID=1052685 RepID=A0A8E2AP34_9APHY|nr:hypothetical protein OBBRIDRAFT_805483 [Obba rivulosa]